MAEFIRRDGRGGVRGSTRRGTAVRQAAREQARAAVSGSKAEAAGAPRAGSLHRVRPARQSRTRRCRCHRASVQAARRAAVSSSPCHVHRAPPGASRPARRAQTCALRTAAAFGVICATVPGLGFQLPELHFEVRRKAGQIILYRGVDPRRLLLPDRQDQDLHRLAWCEGRRSTGPSNGRFSPGRLTRYRRFGQGLDRTDLPPQISSRL